MDTFLLSLHLFSASATLVAILAAGYAVITKKQWLEKLFNTIAWLGFAGIASGSLLSIVARQSVTTFCANIGAYLLIITATESLVWLKIRKNHPSLNPVLQTSLLSGASIVLVILILMN
jgi:hypothetical protein